VAGVVGSGFAVAPKVASAPRAHMHLPPCGLTLQSLPRLVPETGLACFNASLMVRLLIGFWFLLDWGWGCVWEGDAKGCGDEWPAQMPATGAKIIKHKSIIIKTRWETQNVAAVPCRRKCPRREPQS